MKKLFSIIFVLSLSFSLTACGETKEEKVVNQIEEILELDSNELADKMMDQVEKAGEGIDDETKEQMKDAFADSEDLMEEAREEMNKLKEDLPKTMKVVKFYRECLEDADDKGDAIDCHEEAEEMSDDLGLEDEDEYEKFDAEEEFGDWSKEKKESVLAEIDMAMSMME